MQNRDETICNLDRPSALVIRLLTVRICQSQVLGTWNDNGAGQCGSSLENTLFWVVSNGGFDGSQSWCMIPACAMKDRRIPWRSGQGFQLYKRHFATFKTVRHRSNSYLWWPLVCPIINFGWCQWFNGLFTSDMSLICDPEGYSTLYTPSLTTIKPRPNDPSLLSPLQVTHWIRHLTS